MKCLKPILLFLALTSYSSIFCADNRGTEFDVQNYSINLKIQNFAAQSIFGFTEIEIKSVKNNLTKVTFDLALLKVDSITQNQNRINFTQNDSELVVNLNGALNIGEATKIKIYYGGKPTKDISWGGFYFTGNYAFNMGVGFNVYPHNYGRVWFPCVDNFTDRSTYDFHITTDSGYMALCNGLPQPATINTDKSVTWHWLMNQTIPTYLACVAVSTYTPVKYTFKGKEKSFEVILAAQAADTNNVKASMINLPKALQFFEDKYSAYPFDRAGYVMVPFNGGAMEHATCITYPLFGVNGTLNYETLMAHELSHMWWGNMVTCDDEQEMWLNEGWASYSEAIFLEMMYDKSKYYTEMNENLITVLRSAHLRDGSFLVLNKIPTKHTYGDHVYKKGALTAAALRYYMGDEAFFKACNSYLNAYKYQSSNSNKLRDEFQKFTNVNLTKFFNDWVFTPGGVALFASEYKVNGDVVALNIRQQSRGNEISYQYIPFKITFFDAAGSKFVHTDSLTAYQKQIQVKMPTNFKPVFLIVNENNELPLARTYSMQNIKGTGVKAFTDALLSINVQQNTDSATVLAEHYWAAANQYEVLPKNIRISNYRFWNIDGSFDSTKLKGQLYLNYDGSTPSSFTSGYLDYTLPLQNEDSLVLLFKPIGTSNWVLHTDNTKITGGSKTDKVGRFITNKIEKGMYAFGVYDSKVSVNNKSKKQLDFKLYPNPAKQNIEIEIPSKLVNSQASIIDANGNTKQSVVLNSTKQTIQLDGLAKGVYFFTIYNALGNFSKTFVVE